jgi:protein tyrosine phosphatase (PTP) superfamily phosphohydrolase (DUF442 family)
MDSKQMRREFCYWLVAFQILTVIPAIADEVPASNDSKVGSAKITDNVIDKNLPRLHSVDPGIWRGGQPTHAGIDALKERGIKTIINFRTDPLAVEEETAYAKKIGINEVKIPIRGERGPQNDQLDKFFALVRDDNAKPIFMHCDGGRDRTGLMVALYRKEIDQWPVQKAYKEMVELGFTRCYVWMTNRLYDFDAGDGQLHAPGIRTRVARTAKFIVWFPIIAQDLVRSHIHPAHHHMS